MNAYLFCPILQIRYKGVHAVHVFSLITSIRNQKDCREQVWCMVVLTYWSVYFHFEFSSGSDFSRYVLLACSTLLALRTVRTTATTAVASSTAAASISCLHFQIVILISMIENKIREPRLK